MALNKTTLGTALNNATNAWNDVAISDADLPAARQAYWEKVAECIIDHFKTAIEIKIPGNGLLAPSGGGAVTGTALTGTIL